MNRKMKITTELLLCLQWAFVIQRTEQCLSVGNRNALPSFADYSEGGGKILSNHQAIIPSYQFYCCGNITEWRVDVHPVHHAENQWISTLDLQIWRPSPTEQPDSLGRGVYSLAGNERVSPVSLSAGGAVVTATPGKYAQFRPGDVLGFYLENILESDRGVAVLTSVTFTSELVWYASVAPQKENCFRTYSVGGSGDLNTLTRAAPVISLSTATYDCRPIAYTPPPCATSTSISVTKTVTTSLSSSSVVNAPISTPKPSSNLSSSSVNIVKPPISTSKPSSNLPPSPDTSGDITEPNAASNHPLDNSMFVSTPSDNGQGQSTGDEAVHFLFILGGIIAAFIVAIVVIIVAFTVGVYLKIKRVNRESMGTLTANHRMTCRGKRNIIYRAGSEMQLNEAYVITKMRDTTQGIIRNHEDANEY